MFEDLNFAINNYLKGIAAMIFCLSRSYSQNKALDVSTTIDMLGDKFQKVVKLI